MKNCKLCKHCVYKNPMKIDCKLAYQCDDGEVFGDRFQLATSSIAGLPELFDIKDNFLTFVGEWMNGKECRTGENRANGTVTYLMDGLYLYEFKTREDAAKYLFEDDRSIPYAFAEYDEDESEEKGEETFGEWEFNNGFKPEWLDANKMKFSTIEEGLKAIHEACDKAEISEGEFADYLILNYDECFNSSIEPVIVIQAIQKFRQWDYEMEDDAIECFGGTEALSENGFYGFIFKRDGQSMQLPDGVRVGIVQEDGSIVLDEGISPCFTKVQYALASGSFTEDKEEFENYRIAIGQWDGESNDDDIFHWFSHEDKIIGSHADFIITSYIKDGDSEDKRVSATPRFCIVQNTESKYKVGHYLLSLNPITDNDTIWLPKISEEALVQLRKSDNPVYIAHDWFLQGSYEYGLCTLIDGKIRKLQAHPDAKIVNCGGDFIFESNSSGRSHKGLIAIEVCKDIVSPIFVMERYFDQEETKTSVSLWFESGVSEKTKEEVIELVKTLDSSCFISSIKEDWICVYADDYDHMLEQLPVQLI